MGEQWGSRDAATHVSGVYGNDAPLPLISNGYFSPSGYSTYPPAAVEKERDKDATGSYEEKRLMRRLIGGKRG